MGNILAACLMRRPTLAECKYEIEFGTPLPQSVHVTLDASVTHNRHVAIIGDVHGCITELKELLTKISEVSENCVLIFCGDLIGKGPYCIETLDFIAQLPNAYSVRGNHDDHVLRMWHDWKQAEKPPKKGHSWVKELTNDHINYLNDLPYTIFIKSHNALVVHAGLDPWKPLNLQQPVNMTNMRNIIDPGGESVITKYIDEGVPWASMWTGPMHIYFGHDARRKLQRYEYATGLDTGCMYGCSLTAAILHHGQEDVLVSVMAKQNYLGASAQNET